MEVAGTLHVSGKITTASVIEGAVSANSSIIGSSTTYTSASAPTDGLLVEGNVGIGVTTPQHKLHVDGSTKLGNSFILDTSGNVGIGTHKPLYKLDVNGIAKINDILDTLNQYK